MFEKLKTEIYNQRITVKIKNPKMVSNWNEFGIKMYGTGNLLWVIVLNIRKVGNKRKYSSLGMIK